MDKTTGRNMRVLVGGGALVMTLYACGGARYVSNFFDKVACKVGDCTPPVAEPFAGTRMAIAINDIVDGFSKAVERYRAIADKPEYASYILAPATNVPFDLAYPEQSLNDFHALVLGQRDALQGRGEVVSELNAVLDDLDDVRRDITYARARKQLPEPQAKNDSGAKPQP